MAYENDPNRVIDPDRPGQPRFRYNAGDGFGWVPMILAVVAVILLIMLLLPTRNDTAPRVTENAPRAERPTAPPASRLTAPAPASSAPQ